MIGTDMMVGAFDSAAPSTPFQFLGWAIGNRNHIVSSFINFSTNLSFFRDSMFSNRYQDDGFRFYENTPSGSGDLIGDFWNNDYDFGRAGD